MQADIHYEYGVFNKRPADLDQNVAEFHFTNPLRITVSLSEANKFMTDFNNGRAAFRERNGLGLELDNLCGEFVDTEVRRRMIITFEFEPAVKSIEETVEAILSA